MADYSGTSKLLIVCSLIFFGACNSLEPFHKVQDPAFTEKVPQIIEKFIATSKPNRTVGSIGHERAFEYIKGQFDEIATEVKGRVIVHEFTPDISFAKRNYESDFNILVKSKFKKDSTTYKKWRRFTDNAVRFLDRFQNIKGRNLILEIPGRSNINEVIYIGAHYDTINSDKKTMEFLPNASAPGADDNASGVGALIALARELRHEKPDRTLRFVAFDYEELFFLGSYALAKDLNSMRPRWMRPGEVTTSLFNLEMIGWSKTALTDHPTVKLYGRQNGQPGFDQDYNLALAFQRAAGLLKSPLKPVILQNGFNRSDNWSFWQKSFPSICISQDWENDFNSSHYHSATDTASTLNIDYIKEITRVMAETISEISRDNLMRAASHQ